MAFSDIVGGFTKSYLYTNLARDAVRLWNRLGDLDLMDIDKERLLRKIGVVPYAPASRTGLTISSPERGSFSPGHSTVTSGPR